MLYIRRKAHLLQVDNATIKPDISQQVSKYIYLYVFSPFAG